MPPRRASGKRSVLDRGVAETLQSRLRTERRSMTRLFAIPAAALAIIVVAVEAGAGATVQAVERRGELVCGVANDLHGFSAPDSKGQWSGLDVDVCRAVAAAVFADA